MQPSFYLNLVEEFHRAFQYCQPTPIAPVLTDPDRNALRIKLLEEERDETHAAHADKNQVAFLDGLCDFQYVLSGAILALGFQRYFGGELRPIVSLQNVEIMLTLAKIKVAVLEKYLSAQDQEGTLHTLVFLQRLAAGIVNRSGLADVFEDAFAEVHRSNISKGWTLEEAIDFPMAGRFVETNSGFICYREDGKILKSPSYSPADLSPFIHGYASATS